MISLLKAILVHLLLALPTLQAPDSKEWTPGIQGYHFHVYFNHTDPVSIQEAIVLRKQVRSGIERGILGNCRLNVFNYVPVGPHPGGSYETCCNVSSMANALSFFMENRGNLTILLHPLTRYEIVDHTDRAMFLGEVTALKLSALSEDLGNNIDHCAPFDFNVTDPEVHKSPRLGKIAAAANLINDVYKTYQSIGSTQKEFIIVEDSNHADVHIGKNAMTQYYKPTFDFLRVGTSTSPSPPPSP